MRERVLSAATDRVRSALNIGDKAERNAALALVRSEVVDELAGDHTDLASADVSPVFKEIEKRELREQILTTGRRSDGRGVDDVRPIAIEVGLLPRTHGSALFTRGQTQALGVATLGTQEDEQRIDSIDSPLEQKKSFMLHYNFRPFLRER